MRPEILGKQRVANIPQVRARVADMSTEAKRIRRYQ